MLFELSVTMGSIDSSNYQQKIPKFDHIPTRW